MTNLKVAIRSPRNPKGVKAVPISLRLTEEESAKTDQYASKEVRSRAAFARMIFLRGLEEYERELAAAT